MCLRRLWLPSTSSAPPNFICPHVGMMRHIDEVLKMLKFKCSWRFLVLDEHPYSIGSEIETEAPHADFEERGGAPGT